MGNITTTFIIVLALGTAIYFGIRSLWRRFGPK